MKRTEKENLKKILKVQKEKFIEAVVRSAEALDLPIPHIKFWKTLDFKHFPDGEKAHIHVETNTICISETELEKLSFEDINNTASHEVAHLKEIEHNQQFSNIQSDTEVGLWRPPLGEGIRFIDSRHPIEKESEEKKKKRKERVVKSKCNYHICGKKGKTYQCKYCKNYFCKEHKKPDEVDMTGKISINEGSHPCFPYSSYLAKEKKKQEKEYGKALEKMFSKKKKYFEIEEVEEIVEKPKKTTRMKKESNINKLALKKLKSKQKETKEEIEEEIDIHQTALDKLKTKKKEEPLWNKIKNFFSS